MGLEMKTFLGLTVSASPWEQLPHGNGSEARLHCLISISKFWSSFLTGTPPDPELVEQPVKAVCISSNSISTCLRWAEAVLTVPFPQPLTLNPASVALLLFWFVALSTLYTVKETSRAWLRTSEEVWMCFS